MLVASMAAGKKLWCGPELLSVEAFGCCFRHVRPLGKGRYTIPSQGECHFVTKLAIWS